MKIKLTNEEITNLRKDRLIKIEKEYELNKQSLLDEENSINSLITHVHNLSDIYTNSKDNKEKKIYVI